ncbi:MAG: hypothetical protein ACRCYQ_11295 [Nocardioides sp.]
MSDLIVSASTLEDSQRALTALKSEFDSIENRRQDTERVWGHDGLRNAMGEFASNWDHHRDALSQKIQDNGEKVATTLDTWREADQKLADELARNSSREEGPR